MAYEQFYTAGYLSIYDILTDLWYHLGQISLILKMEFFLSRRFETYIRGSFYTVWYLKNIVCKSDQKLDSALRKH